MEHLFEIMQTLTWTQNRLFCLQFGQALCFGLHMMLLPVLLMGDIMEQKEQHCGMEICSVLESKPVKCWKLMQLSINTLSS